MDSSFPLPTRQTALFTIGSSERGAHFLHAFSSKLMFCACCMQDRPGCQKQKGDPQYEEEGALVNCNVRIADVERMENVVGQAIRRWYAEFGDGSNLYGQQ